MGNSNDPDEATKEKDKDIESDISKSEKTKFGEFDQLFLKFDENKNGNLSEEEFKCLLDHYIILHPEKKEKVQELQEQIEIDDLNPINQEEFRSLMYYYLACQNISEQLVEVFKIFDRQMENEISIVEIIHVFNKLGLRLSSEEVEQMLLEADDSGDGTLDFEEFILLLTAK